MSWWMMIPAVLQAGGTILGGMAENKASKLEAAQIRRQAQGERAGASMAAAEAMRQSRLAESRAIAVGAASGGSNADPTFVNALADLKALGEYNALSALYEGETAARTLDYSAKVRRWEGRMAQRRSIIEGAAVLGDAGMSMYQKYGGSRAAGGAQGPGNTFGRANGFNTSAYLSTYGAGPARRR